MQGEMDKLLHCAMPEYDKENSVMVLVDLRRYGVRRSCFPLMYDLDARKPVLLYVQILDRTLCKERSNMITAFPFCIGNGWRECE